MYNVNENLLCAWNLDEASGGSNRVDSAGNYNLVPSGSQSSSPGIVGSGFAVANVYATYLDLSPAALSGQAEWGLSVWVNPTSVASNPRLLEFGVGVSDRVSWMFREGVSTTSSRIGIRSTTLSVDITVPFCPALNVWTLMTLGIGRGTQVSYMTPPSGAHSSFVNASSAHDVSTMTPTSIRLLGGAFGTTTDTWAGVADQMVLWRRMPDLASHKWLWNRGLGRDSAAVLSGRPGLVKPPPLGAIARAVRSSQPGGEILPAEGQLWPR